MITISSIGGKPFTSRCSVYRNGVQSIPTDTPTKVEFNAENYDQDSEFANFRFTPKEAGYYDIKAQGWIGAVGGDKQCHIHLEKNGNEIARSSDDYSYNYLPGIVSKDVYLDGDTDYIEVIVYHNSGVNRDLLGTAETTWLTAHRFA